MYLVTGGGGFIGGRLCAALAPMALRVLARRPVADRPTCVADLAFVDLASLSSICQGVDTIFHCAGFAHAWKDFDARMAGTHWRINFEGTRKLVNAAGATGVRRFIFLSSVKAMGEPGNHCVDENWPSPPETAYGQSKRAAEEAVLEAGTKYDMHVVNLRLTMVYGRGGRGNLERMARLIRRGWFPPLPETGNKRSLVHVDDVVAAMKLVAGHAKAAGKTFIIADPQFYSGRELYELIRAALEIRPTNLAVPANLLVGAARCFDGVERLLKRRLPFDSESLNKLLGWACYSSDSIRRELGWQARVPLAQGLRELL